TVAGPWLSVKTRTWTIEVFMRTLDRPVDAILAPVVSAKQQQVAYIDIGKPAVISIRVDLAMPGEPTQTARNIDRTLDTRELLSDGRRMTRQWVLRRRRAEHVLFMNV